MRWSSWCAVGWFTFWIIIGLSLRVDTDASYDNYFNIKMGQINRSSFGGSLSIMPRSQYNALAAEEDAKSFSTCLIIGAIGSAIFWYVSGRSNRREKEEEVERERRRAEERRRSEARQSEGRIIEATKQVIGSQQARLPMRILFLAANPNQTTALDLEEELRSLEQQLAAVKFRDSISLTARHAARPDDLIRYVREDRPTVIHFSGHGSKEGIILRSDEAGYHAVDGTRLSRFLANRGVSLVVLNSCYSKSQGGAILDSVEAVVGTTDVVADDAARRFTVAFYRSLGNGLSVREAFRDGSDAQSLYGHEDIYHSDGNLDLVLLVQD